MTMVFSKWLPFAVIVTAFCMLGYVTVQQSLRQGANDPQIQMAEDAAAALTSGASAESILPKAQVEMSTSLAPFLVLFDSSGRPTASAALLHGAMPDYPKGALDAAKQSGENRVTWKPSAGVRIASVAVPYSDGFVVGGRSLREVEKRESQTQMFAITIWLLTLVAVFVAIVFGEFMLSWRA
jgi:hypothetical protein